MDLRTRTAQQYRYIRKLLRSDNTLPPDTDRFQWLRWVFYMFFIIVLLAVFVGCANASETINIPSIVNIESSGHLRAFNRHSGAIGLCQITPIVLKEYNNRWKTQWHTADLYNADLNIMVATWYLEDRIPQLLRHYHIKDTVRNRLWAYNAGIRAVKRGVMPLETKNYIVKYEGMSND